MDRVHDGELHQREEDEESADEEPDVDVLDVVDPGHVVVDVLVQIDVSQPASCACNVLILKIRVCVDCIFLCN